MPIVSSVTQVSVETEYIKLIHDCIMLESFIEKQTCSCRNKEASVMVHLVGL